jgi:hypothetical protein
VTTKQFVGNAEFNKTRDSILEVLDSDARIPDVAAWAIPVQLLARQGTPARHLAAHHAGRVPQGRTPQWEVLLDIDALNKAERQALGVQGRAMPEAEVRPLPDFAVARWRRCGDRARIRYPEQILRQRTASSCRWPRPKPAGSTRTLSTSAPISVPAR